MATSSHSTAIWTITRASSWTGPRQVRGRRKTGSALRNVERVRRRKPPEPGASHNRSTARAFRTNGFMEAGYELSRMGVLKSGYESECNRKSPKHSFVETCKFRKRPLYTGIEFGLTTALFRLALLAARSEQSLQTSKNCTNSQR